MVLLLGFADISQKLSYLVNAQLLMGTRAFSLLFLFLLGWVVLKLLLNWFTVFSLKVELELS